MLSVIVLFRFISDCVFAIFSGSRVLFMVVGDSVLLRVVSDCVFSIFFSDRVTSDSVHFRFLSD